MRTTEGIQGGHRKRAFLSPLRCGSSPHSPSPIFDEVVFNAVLSSFPLQRIALIQELIVLTLTCFNGSKVSINHFLVALLITALR